MSENHLNSDEIEQVQEEEDEFAELDDLDKHMLKLRIQYPAISAQKIADKVGCHRSTVERRIKSARFLKAIEDYESRDLHLAMANRREVMKLQKKAIDTITEMLDSENPNERMFALSKVDIMKGVMPDLQEITATHSIPNAIQVELVGDEQEPATS